MDLIFTPGAPRPIGPYSQAVAAGGLVFCSGQLALDPETGAFTGGDVARQTRQAAENLRAVLEAAGLGFEHVVKTTCFLAQMADFDAFNQVYEEYFISRPARSCVAAKELPKGALVEIEAIACKS